MKHPFYFMLTALVALFFSCSAPQNTAALAERSFKVWGNCDQCQATIEKAAALPGVSNISWNEKSGLLKFAVDTTLASDDAVLKAVAAAGYDNERYTADNAAYAGLPECCQYERKASETDPGH
jgi:periplasmic mercuric ion binding protein